MAVLAKQTDRQRSAPERTPAASRLYMNSTDSDEYKRWVQAAARFVKEVYIHEVVPEGWRRNLIMTGLVLWARACPIDHKKHVALYPQKNEGKLKKTFTNRLNKILRALIKNKNSETQPPDWHDFKHKFGDRQIFEIYLSNFDHYEIDRPIKTAGGLSNFIHGQKEMLLSLIDPRNSASNSAGLLSFKSIEGEFNLPNPIDEDSLRDVIKHLVRNGY